MFKCIYSEHTNPISFALKAFLLATEKYLAVFVAPRFLPSRHCSLCPQKALCLNPINSNSTHRLVFSLPGVEI